MATNTNDPTKPNYTRADVVKVADDLELIADLLEGSRRMWEQSQVKKYIRKWTDESDAVYKIRSQCETVFGGLSRILTASVGMLFAKMPLIVWNDSEAAMNEHWDNIDGQGTAGEVFVKRFSESSIRAGIALIFVDHVTAPADEVVTAASEKALGLRPIWSTYEREQIISWHTEIVNGILTLTQVVARERSQEKRGDFGVEEVERYRVFRLTKPAGADPIASWELWTSKDKVPVFEKSGVFRTHSGKPLSRLPLAIAYTGRTDAPLCAAIPLLGVAWANLSHWRISTDLTFSRSVAAYAQPVVVGALAPTRGASGATVAGKLKLGPLVVVHLEGEGASFDWKAPPIDAFEAQEKGIAEKLAQMGQLGLQFLVSDTRAAETATAKRLDATAENSTLATAARGIQDAVNLALELHAEYLGIANLGAPVMTISTDFEAVTLDAQTMSAYVDAIARAGLPMRLLLEAWQQGGRIPEDADLDEIEAEMMSNKMAADQAAADAAANSGFGGGAPDAGKVDAPARRRAQ